MREEEGGCREVVSGLQFIGGNVQLVFCGNTVYAGLKDPLARRKRKMKNLQNTNTGSLLLLALAACIACVLVLLTPLPANAVCCQSQCSISGCCSAQGECATCENNECCFWDGDPCEGGQKVNCASC